MTADLATPELTEDEARRITADIKAWAGTLWTKLKAAHDGKAWKAMGYTSWADYVGAEFDMSRSYAYRLVSHANAVHELAGAAGLDPEVSPMGDTLAERETRAIDTSAVAAKVAERVAAEPEADEHRRAEIVEETIEEHKTSTKTTTTIDADTGEKLDESTADAPTSPVGEPADEAPGGAPPTDGAGEPEGNPAATEEGGGSPSPAPSEDLDAAPLSPAMQRLKFAGTATRALGVVRERLLPLDPDQVIEAIPVDERDLWASLSRDLRAYCDRIDSALTPSLRSVQ